MNKYSSLFKLCFFLFFQILILNVKAQQYNEKTYWSADGNKIMAFKEGNIIEINALDSKENVLISKDALTPENQEALEVESFSFSNDHNQVLIYTNSKKVWRYNTRGDYWLYNLSAKTLKKIGQKFNPSSLMFAKFSPNGKQVAYVQEHNIYVEDLATSTIKALTSSGSKKLINGTFDWVYEEEFECRDGFRWSPDSQSIAFWQIDASVIPNYLMINNTDSLYPFTVPVEYPVVGQDPSSCKIGVININNTNTNWMNVPGSSIQNYIPRMEWLNNQQLVIQQLNRRQNLSTIYLLESTYGNAKSIYKEIDSAWIDAKPEAESWEFLNNKTEFLWLSDKDGWRHAYAIGFDGKERLLTEGNYDVIEILSINEKTNSIYFSASPSNATQSYLYKVALNGGNRKAVKISPSADLGTHEYDISPNGKLAFHYFSNSHTYPISDVVSLPKHQRLSGGEVNPKAKNLTFNPEFFRVTSSDGITMDGWMVKPKDFDANKKYPVLFYVYGEPASQTVKDVYGIGRNRLYEGNMQADGYIYISVDGRGSPAPKGKIWRKSIYHRIGDINIRDQAMAAKEILKWSYVDTSRVAVWGWSGGGSSTLNLLFQYPEIYKTGISIAAVDNQLNYDNIYQERYMGLLPEDKHFFVDNSPLAHAKKLQGNLLLIHGTGDDNVHFNNAEQMINELIKYNKPFQLMTYPNRTHSISEGEGTKKHLATIFTKYLKEHCPPGAR